MKSTHDGQQVVINGSGFVPFTNLCSNSLASSMIVTSAAKLVSNTALKPNLLNRAYNFPVKFFPATPNASPMEALTAGAICTTQYLSGFSSAFQTFGTSKYSTIAPVGQCAEHWPHFMHGDSANVISPAGENLVFMPRWRNESAHTSCISWQT